MRSEESHLTDQELLQAADAELPPAEEQRVRSHLAGCWTCRARMRDVEETIADFVRARETASPRLPPEEGPRALLRARMAALSPSIRPSVWRRIAGGVTRRRSQALAPVACLAVLMVIAALRIWPWRSEWRASIPDPALTPGATVPLTREDVCAAGAGDAPRVVPVHVAKEVFAAYGIDRPEPRAYEVDYLITPALGGSDHIRNFWPQPYRNTMWNAHIKDALEDHLQRLVCDGRVELTKAQQEIARDWIAAYKKYFRTDAPLAEHATFLKDRPWE